MSYTTSLSPAALFASQFIAHYPRTPARGRTKRVLQHMVRTFGTIGLVLGGAYPHPRVRRMIRA